jgi:hypothetical protein
MLFSQHYRAQVKTDHPEATFGGLGKILGENWATVDAAEKKKFQDDAKKLKAAYEIEKEAYLKNKTNTTTTDNKSDSSEEKEDKDSD